MPLRPALDEAVAQLDQRVALVVRVLPPTSGRGRCACRLDVGEAVAQRGVDVVAEEARPLHEVAVGVDDPATPGVRH